MLRSQVIPSILLIIMGTIDCITTVIGILCHGATELNPLMAGIVSTNIGAFLVVKLVATMIAATSFVVANKTLMNTQNKGTKTFIYSSKLIKIASAGLIVFLAIVVANNLLVLFG
ncbi:MAG: DUF5658 family protein [Candidatus Bathyarchaeia archaeon]